MSDTWGVLIPLHPASAGSFLVDVDDATWIRRWKWHVLPNGYVVRYGGGGRRDVYLSRLLLKLEPGDPRQADHVNRNRRDNRRSNLRVASSAQNAQNKPSLGGSSRHRGVTWDKRRGKWAAFAQLAGKRYNLGRFDDEETAALVASDWRREHMPFAVEDVQP